MAIKLTAKNYKRVILPLHFYIVLCILVNHIPLILLMMQSFNPLCERFVSGFGMSLLHIHELCQLRKVERVGNTEKQTQTH